jgi:hypothetical protein
MHQGPLEVAGHEQHCYKTAEQIRLYFFVIIEIEYDNSGGAVKIQSDNRDSFLKH